MNLKAAWKHLKTITKHKAIVCLQCVKCGYLGRGLMHDNSKFVLAEFMQSAKYFQGVRSPIEAQKAAEGYSAAWQHHKGHNPHHWEYWMDFAANGQLIANKIPYKYVVEMVCDWIGAGMVYGHGKWTQNEPLEYYNKVRNGRHFHSETENLLVAFLSCIKYDGLAEFYKMARCKGKYAHLRVKYEKNVSK